MQDGGISDAERNSPQSHVARNRGGVPGSVGGGQPGGAVVGGGPVCEVNGG